MCRQRCLTLCEDLQALLDGWIYLVDNGIIPFVVKDESGNQGFCTCEDDIFGKDDLFAAFGKTVILCKCYELF